MSKSGVFFYICSNGRCGTQFLARRLAEMSGTDVVIHEAIGLQMASREVFRDPDQRYKQIGKSPELQKFLLHVSNVIGSGRNLVFCGWHAYAYLDYFQERYGAHFRYVHLVRNPYENAMSHATNHPMVPGFENPNLEKTKIFGGDPNIIHKNVAARYDDFGSLERQLFHWLEVTRFVKDLEHLEAYSGLLHFEAMFDPATTVLDDLASQVLGRDVKIENREPFDRVHSTFRGRGVDRIDPLLVKEVNLLAQELGYTEEALRIARDPVGLTNRYTERRYDVQIAPGTRVVE